uniref:phosphoribosylformylglycinamidine synthase subunit PurQ n=1 Tax=Pararhizobium sp. IMCC3301 TaxID=3067904 RepID=UPI002740EDA1|nr:phosphoribosylformylglycinamidine synthase subunit PurQ [Pararhizobium sp. IMCC3301]
MKSAVIIFPGSNRDRDMIKALEDISGQKPAWVWHQETTIPDVDLIVLPGGFSYGDYLRAGAIAARAPVLRDLQRHAARGTRILGVCNGFQILTEAGFLPGALMRNAGLNFVCRTVQLVATNTATVFSQHYRQGESFPCPVAHHDGNYFADARTLDELESNNRVVFRYADGTNPNGSLNDIAGIINADGTVMGLMPHPENLIENLHGGVSGRGIFTSLLEAA